MSKHVCAICGYIYDELERFPWSDLPPDWVCSFCGAPKEVFIKQEDTTVAEEVTSRMTTAFSEDLREMSPLEMSALCANLARGCEKQYKVEEAALFTTLATFYKKAAKPATDPQLDQLLELINHDLAEGYPKPKK